MNYTCQKCGHKWSPKVTGKTPLSCPKCKRYDYAKKPAINTILSK